MKTVAVDIGNSSVKFRVTDVQTESHVHLHDQTIVAPPFAAPVLPLDRQPSNWFVCSVNRKTCQWLVQWIHQDRPQDRVHLFKNCDFPVAIEVEHPDRVGTDRVAAVVGARQLCGPNQSSIVVDFGTATTVDCLSSDGAFVGGAILPGLGISFEQLATKTDALPYVGWETDGQPPAAIGINTESAIMSGVYWGQVGAAKELIHQMKGRLGGQPQVLVTGGTGQRLFKHFDPSWRWVPDLVCDGVLLAAMKWLEENKLEP